MSIPRMDTTRHRAFRKVKDNLFVEVTTLYLNLYDGLGQKISSKKQQEILGQVYVAVSPEAEPHVKSNTGIEKYTTMDGIEILLVGTGRDIQGNLV